jgi:hypothetical protein
MKNWFVKHINLTWAIFYTLTLILALYNVVNVELMDKPTKSIYHNEPKEIQIYRGDGSVDMTVSVPNMVSKKVIDEDAIKNRRFAVGLFWFWPIYIIGWFLTTKWALRHKNQGLGWMWLAFIFPIIVLILKDNRLLKS